MKLTDESLMPFGKYKGEKMANVPASYLKWIYDEWTLPNPRFGFVNNDVKEYIEENLDVIQEELKRKPKNNIKNEYRTYRCRRA